MKWGQDGQVGNMQDFHTGSPGSSPAPGNLPNMTNWLSVPFMITIHMGYFKKIKLYYLQKFYLTIAGV